MEKGIVEILKNLEKTSEQFWNIPQTTAQFLHIVVRSTNAKKILEIGTSNGYSGIYFAEALSHVNGRLYTIESHKKRFELARYNFEQSGLTPFIQQIFGHAPEILSQIEETFDLIFLDATKMEYKSYIEVLLPKLKPGGLIISDNAISHSKAMKDYTDFINTQQNLENTLLPIDNGLMISYKPKAPVSY